MAELGRIVWYTDPGGRTLAGQVIGQAPGGRLALAVLTPDLATGTVALTGRLAAFDAAGGPGTWRWPTYGKSYSDREEVPDVPAP